MKGVKLITTVTLLLGVMPLVLMHAGLMRRPYRTEIAARFVAPSHTHPFGTDDLGRDLLARTLFATGLSLSVAGRALLVALVLGVVLGALAGYAKNRWPDHLISYIIALIHTVPFILLSVALAAVLQANIDTIYLIIGCIAWAPPARLVRAEVMRLRNARFVTAEKAFGLHPLRIFFCAILPLTLLPPLVGLLYLTPELVGIDVGLSYFGLGAQPPTPTIGRLIYDGMNSFRSAWWMPTLPSLVLVGFFLILYTALDRFGPHYAIESL